AFEAIAPARRTSLMEVAIDDACDAGRSLAPRRAAPIHVPRDLGNAALLALGVAALAMLEVRGPHRALPSAQTIAAASLSPDDIQLFKQASKDLDRQSQNPDVKAAIERFNQLIEDLANKRLDRTEAFRRMEAIERELLQGAEADKKEFEDELEETGTEL